MKLMEIATSNQKDFYQQVSYNLRRSVHNKENSTKMSSFGQEAKWSMLHENNKMYNTVKQKDAMRYLHPFVSPVSVQKLLQSTLSRNKKSYHLTAEMNSRTVALLSTCTIESHLMHHVTVKNLQENQTHVGLNSINLDCICFSIRLVWS